MLTSGTIVTPELLDAWLATRTLTVGASEAAAALGVDRWCSPIELWQRKVGLAAPATENEAMRWGHLLEPILRERYTEETGREVRDSQLYLRDPDLPISATLDGRTECNRVVEIKTVGAYTDGWGEPGTDEVPDRTIVQVHQQMLLAGAEIADVACLVAGQRFALYTVRRDEAICQAIREGVATFWRFVVHNEPPDYGFQTVRTLAYRNPQCAGETSLPADVERLVVEYELACDGAKEVEERKDALKLQVLEAMGNHEFGLLSDGRRVKRYRKESPACEKVVKYKASVTHYFSVLKAKGAPR